MFKTYHLLLENWSRHDSCQMCQIFPCNMPWNSLCMTMRSFNVCKYVSFFVMLKEDNVIWFALLQSPDLVLSRITFAFLYRPMCELDVGTVGR